MKIKEFEIEVSQDEDGIYIGKAIGLKGCVTHGKTLEELNENLEDAIQLCLDCQ